MSEPSRRPTRSQENLAPQIAAKLRDHLNSGKLMPGDRLPTEQELVRMHGVSRAVVREAIAELRSAGLVIAKRGSGVFVADVKSVEPGMPIPTFDPDKLSSAIEMLEFRIAVECEAAALSAERVTPGELAKIKEHHAAFFTAFTEHGRPETVDFDLHLAIAESTHNRYFVDVFRYLGSRTIPSILALSANEAAKQIRDEHHQVVEAIGARNPAKARQAMRLHLLASQSRYARILSNRSLDLSDK